MVPGCTASLNVAVKRVPDVEPGGTRGRVLGDDRRERRSPLDVVKVQVTSADHRIAVQGPAPRSAVAV